MKPFRDVVTAFVNCPNRDNSQRVISYFQHSQFDLDDIALLTKKLSGETQFQFPDTWDVVDIPSTGGPSSLSTLICPLILCCGGSYIPKLGVPGRPAGGIDAMSQIEGYKNRLLQTEVMNILNECHYAHFLPSEKFTPLDGILFSHRKTLNAINVPALAIASLLAKKIAVGIIRVGLEIRVSPWGNMGTNWDDAKNNAQIFIKIAKRFNIDAICFLTNGENPYQPYIGRSAALYAMNDILNKTNDKRLAIHYELCRKMSAILLKNHEWNPEYSELINVLERHLFCQGSCIDNFYKEIKHYKKLPVKEIRSRGTGVLRIDLQAIRNVVTKVQKKEDSSNSKFSDLINIELCVECNSNVINNDVIAIIKYSRDIEAETYHELEDAFSISDINTTSLKDQFEVIYD